jgi:hypothetical protein
VNNIKNALFEEQDLCSIISCIEDGEPIDSDDTKKLAIVLKQVREIHKPFGIYDECDHDHAEGEEGTIYVDDIGIVCDKPMYSICTNCCAFGGDSQSEECASAHDHGPGKPICATAALWS